MPEIILEKRYKAEIEIIIAEGFVYTDGVKTDKITPCSFHPLEIVSGRSYWKEGKIFIKGE